MPYCPRCGVEVDPCVRDCPLCSTSIPSFADLGPGEPAWPDPGDGPARLDPSKTYLAPAQRRFRAFLTVAAVFLSAAVAVLVADFVTNGAITWSRYPLASMVTVLCFLASSLAWRRHLVAVAITWFLVTTALLGVLDAVSAGGWFPTLGFPLTTVTFVLTLGGVWTMRRCRRKGFNLFALAFVLVAVELLAIDGLVTFWWSGGLGWSWSLITTVVLAPLSLLFFLLHLTFRPSPDLPRIFHF